ncbi:unnamed protein product, partial [Bubo scandiacus]
GERRRRLGEGGGVGVSVAGWGGGGYLPQVTVFCPDPIRGCTVPRARPCPRSCWGSAAPPPPPPPAVRAVGGCSGRKARNGSAGAAPRYWPMRTGAAAFVLVAAALWPKAGTAARYWRICTGAAAFVVVAAA